MEKEFKKDYPYTCLFGIPFDYTTLNQNYTNDSNMCNKIIHMCNKYRKDNFTRHIVTVNMDFITKCFSFLPSKQKTQEQKYLLEILCSADFVVADGMPLVLMSIILGTPLPQRVTGADLVPALARLSSHLRKQINSIDQKSSLSHSRSINKASLNLYFLGGGKGVAKKAVVNLQKKYPDMDVVGISSPDIKEIKFGKKEDNTHNTDDDDAQIIKEINASKADILFLALGNPKQEFWFAQHRNKIQVPVTIGVGGALDFLANQTSRAPKWMQNIGFEWIWRMVHDPKRLVKRYTLNFIKLVSLGFPLVLGHTVCFLYAYVLQCCMRISKKTNTKCTKNEKKIILNNEDSKVGHSIKDIDNDKNIQITFNMPTIVSKKSLYYIEDKVAYYLENSLTKKCSLYIVLDMKKTIYIDMSALAIFIRLLYSIKKEEDRTEVLETQGATCKKICTFIHLTRSISFLLWCTGAYASLRDAIENSTVNI